MTRPPLEPSLREKLKAALIDSRLLTDQLVLLLNNEGYGSMAVALQRLKQIREFLEPKG